MDFPNMTEMDSASALTSEQVLSKSQNYREFLALAIDLQFSQGGRANLSAFSRRAGFASRSFIVDLLSGKKRLTIRSLPKVIQALKLRGDLRILFETLVFLEERDLPPAKMKEAFLQNRLTSLRQRLNQEKKSHALSNAKLFFAIEAVFPVYAALGSLEAGASLFDICSRTQLDMDCVRTTLDRMIDHGCVRQFENRFYATEVHLSVNSLGENFGFQKAYKRSLQDLNQVIDTQKNDPTCLVSHSAFSVKKSDLPRLKKKLEQVIAQFISEEHLDEGDCVTKLTLGMYRSPKDQN